MLKSMLKVAAATALFGVVHSALASRAAKDEAARALGRRNRNGLYRLFYVGQSLATAGALWAYIRARPDRELYHVRGPLAWLLRAGQGAALLYGLSAARQVGVGKMAGLTSFRAWLDDAEGVPPEPEAQGPAFDGADMVATGPFRDSRHPLNLAPVPFFWLMPRMTANLLAFNLVATAYFVVGSRHEEARLRAAYGPAYDAYRASGVPFYVPGPAALPPPDAGAVDAAVARPYDEGERTGSSAGRARH